MNRNSLMRMAAPTLTAAALFAGSTPASAQQASLTLSGSDVALCHFNNTSWELTKNGTFTPALNDPTKGTATFTVTATKGTTTPNTIKVNGYVTITNTGSAPATIGNIVVNLQKSIKGGKFATAASDVADATNGDGATSAKIVAGSSSENLISFTESLGSGPLSFTDFDSNTTFSLVPQPVIPVGASKTLLFQASFNNTELKIPAGTSVRSEVIVSFGNAGARGGSGATAKNIDINGNGNIDADEANVRSVPTRITSTLPALESCNNPVTLSDLESSIVTTGAVTASNPVGTFSQSIGVTTQKTVTVDVSIAGAGTLTNTAALTGESDTVDLTVVVGGLPQIVTFTCCDAVELQASKTLSFDGGGTPPGDPDLKFTTYSKGGYGGKGVPGKLFDANYATVFTTGLTIGDYNPAGTPNGAKWTADAAGQSALKTYLTSSANGASGSLTGDTLNATSTSGGQLPRQTAALTLNIRFSDAGVTNGGFGNLYYKADSTSDALYGKTIRQILDAANQALAGGALPSGYNHGDLNTLVANLNLSFDNGDATGWALNHLSTTAP